MVQGVAAWDADDLTVLFSRTKDWGVALKMISREKPDGAVWVEQNAGLPAFPTSHRLFY